MAHPQLDLGSDYLNSLPESRDPLDLLLDAEQQAIEEWNDNRDRPDFVRVGRQVYVAKRRSYLIDKGGSHA